MAQVPIPPAHAHDPFGYALTGFAPEIGAAAGGFAKAVYQHSRLPLRVLEAARYRTAAINGCELCIGFRAAEHVGPLLDAMGGDSAASIATRGGPAPDEAFYAAVADWRASPWLSERERLAAEYAERVGEAPRSLEGDNALWARLHIAFTPTELVDLTLCLAAWIGLGRVAHVLELDGVCAAAAYSRAQVA